MPPPLAAEELLPLYRSWDGNALLLPPSPWAATEQKDTEGQSPGQTLHLIHGGTLTLHLLQEAQQKVLGGSVGGEEATHGLVEYVGIQTTAGGWQGSQGTENKARLLPRHCLFYLLHMFLNVCGDRSRGGVAEDEHCYFKISTELGGS